MLKVHSLSFIFFPVACGWPVLSSLSFFDFYLLKPQPPLSSQNHQFRCPYRRKCDVYKFSIVRRGSNVRWKRLQWTVGCVGNTNILGEGWATLCNTFANPIR